MGTKKTSAKVFSEHEIQSLIDKFKSKSLRGTYHDSASLVAEAADIVNVTDKTVLVIGTQSPWLEAVVLSKHPRKVVTLEYGHFIRYDFCKTFLDNMSHSILASIPTCLLSVQKNSDKEFCLELRSILMSYSPTHQ